jgi:hypothetical protein
MTENEQMEAAATAMAAFGLAQLAFAALMGTPEAQQHLGTLRSLVEGNQRGGPLNRLAATKLEMLLGLYEKQRTPRQ